MIHKVVLCWAPLLLAVILSVPAGELPDPDTLFTEAVTLYEEGMAVTGSDPGKGGELFSQALLRFNYLQESLGIRNGKLYYNTGNTYLMVGDIGNAVLMYRKALLFRPWDRIIHQSIEYAREKREDRLEGSGFQGLSGIVPPGITILLLYIFSGIAWTAGTVRLLIRRNIFVSRVIWISAGAAFVMVALLFADHVSMKRHPAGVILAEEITARLGDGAVYAPAFQDPLHAGLEFRLNMEREGWYYIELEDDLSGWIPASAASLVQIDPR